jgi:N-acetylglucosaminyl-diphospho-decaprenol L-rhamnosyltransferase
VKVAAIVVAHNSARDLPQSLGCLVALPLCRIVVADNASTDNSREVARRYTPHILSLPNSGFGAAVNAAVPGAPEADAYFLLNPDCQITDRCYATLTEAMRDDPRLGAVAPLMRYPDGRFGIAAGPEPSMAKEWLAALRVDHLVPNGLKSWLTRSPLLRGRLPMLAYLDTRPGQPTRSVAWVSGFCMLVRAEAFHAVGGFDPGFFLYFEDVDICRRLREAGWAVASVGTSVAEHKESTSTAAVGKRRLYRTGMSVYFAKHGTRRQRLSARVLRRLPI